MDIKDKILELCEYSDEQEWLEFKENWFQPDALGEYISAMSNAAAFHYRNEAYFMWGINDSTHEIVGTNFNPYQDYKQEPYQNYLARNLSPSINFKFEETEIGSKRVVVLIIPAAEEIPTAFKDKRFIRIGSAKNNIKNYPKREIQLFKILSGQVETIETLPSKYQNLTFRKLFGYYGSRGIVLNEKTFEKNLSLRNKNGEYNLLAQLLSDDSHIPLRVSIFEGKTKGANLFSVREFGNNCLLYTLDNLLQYGDVLNIIQADEKNRIVERKEVPLFDDKAFREAIINAVLHNYWVGGNEPMISVFSDRMEILSRGAIPPGQTKEGFYLGESVPVNEKLSEIFLQLHISEKSGRGVPKIVETYGKEAITFRENSIVVTIPFRKVHEADGDGSGYVREKVGEYIGGFRGGSQQIETDQPVFRKPLNERRTLILNEIRHNPNVSKTELQRIFGISLTAIDNNIAFLRKNGYIERVGETKGGYWHIIE
jgi:ATP-dependent DNA helicase RecG